MSVWQAIQNLFLGPIELLLDSIYAVILRNTSSAGWSVVILSLAVNLFLLPLYKRADSIQKKERERMLRMKPRIDQIKKAFSGNERYMILQTYYRQNHYKPFYALKSSLSLLLQIPIFIAAYRFLSQLPAIQDASFGPIRNLGAPDGILQVGGLTIHLLPILMTGINIVSGFLYSRNMPLKSKIQMYALALTFLILLYNSPSGLVMYWMMNNVFSLIKNLLNRIPCKKVPRPLKSTGKAAWTIPVKCKWLFLVSCIFLTLLTGLLIPSEVIKSSPEEFMNVRYLHNPLLYLNSSFLLAAGTFIVWCSIYFCMSGEKIRCVFIIVFSVFAVSGYANFVFVGKSYGDMSSLLVYEWPISVAVGEGILSILVILVLSVFIFILMRKWPGLLLAVYVAGCFSLAITSVHNMSPIQDSYRKFQRRAEEIAQRTPEIHLSKTGKNVVVIMLDRAIGGFVPYLMNEKPELIRQFDGFVYYPNTLSFGMYTNVGSPALYGGYEYTPDGMASRPDMLLVEKQNEALKVMPVLFLENGYDVTVMDPSLANYQWIPDMSIYDDYPEINSYNVKGVFTDNAKEIVRYTDQILNRNLFCYSIFRISPSAIQPALYHSGDYNATDTLAWTKTDPESLVGVEPNFLQSYWVMENLGMMTKVLGSENGCFLMLATEETHDVTLLQEPDYVPQLHVDNSAYEADHGVRTDADGNSIDISSGGEYLQSHYQCNMSAFLQLGRWFDMLRELNIWDNTRIIVVSDHARNLSVLGFDITEKYPNLERESKINGGVVWTETMAYQPLMMVKDFNAEGFRTDTSFMTNADTPVLATDGLIWDPINLFTGNPITSDPKLSGELHLVETEWHVGLNNGTTFANPKNIYFRYQSVQDIKDIHDQQYWYLDDWQDVN